MRVLIVFSALAACVYGAPSVAPLGIFPIFPVVPTISPGDIEAAVINAKVAGEDLTQISQDNAQLNLENGKINEDKANEARDLANERSQEAFWSFQDQRWQAFDALSTAQANINGAIASNADALAKGSIATPVIAPAVIAGELAPGYITSTLPLDKALFGKPLVKAIPTEAPKEPEANKVESQPEVKPVPSPVALSPTALQPIVLESYLGNKFLVGPFGYIQPGFKTIASSSITQTHGQGLLSPATAIIQTLW